jgi:hypothetical protein
MCSRKALSSAACARCCLSSGFASLLEPDRLGSDAAELPELDELDELDELEDPCSDAVSEWVAAQAIVPIAIDGIPFRTITVRSGKRVLFMVIRTLLDRSRVSGVEPSIALRTTLHPHPEPVLRYPRQ